MSRFDFIKNDLKKLAASYPQLEAFRSISPLLDLAVWGAFPGGVGFSLQGRQIFEVAAVS